MGLDSQKGQRELAYYILYLMLCKMVPCLRLCLQNTPHHVVWSGLEIKISLCIRSHGSLGQGLAKYVY